ncbi:ATP synthase small subunit 6, mitochondrial, partial [Linum perenne]
PISEANIIGSETLQRESFESSSSNSGKKKNTDHKEAMRRLFDPWPVFFKREWNRNWPFLVGFAVTGTIITKMSLGLTEEEAKNSKFVQRHKS